MEIRFDATLLRDSETFIERTGVLDPRVGEEGVAPRVRADVASSCHVMEVTFNVVRRAKTKEPLQQAMDLQPTRG